MENLYILPFEGFEKFLLLNLPFYGWRNKKKKKKRNLVTEKKWTGSGQSLVSALPNHIFVSLMVTLTRPNQRSPG